MDSTVLKKSDAVSSAASIDSAVVSSVWRDPFRERSKRWSKAPLSSMNRSLEFDHVFLREIAHRRDQTGTTSTTPRSLCTPPKGEVRTSP